MPAPLDGLGLMVALASNEVDLETLLPDVWILQPGALPGVPPR